MTQPFDRDEKDIRKIEFDGRCFGSRVAGRVTVPHIPGPADPQVYFDEHRWAVPNEVISAGRFVGNDWADDPAIAWWAEASHPGQDAVRMVQAAGVARGIVALWVTNKRLTVVFPQRYLIEHRERKERSGLLGRAAGWLDTEPAPWQAGEIMHIQASVDAAGVAGFGPARLGRSMPSAAFLGVWFRDRSVLYVRCADPETEVARLNKLQRR
ncbi:hypothetical protein [Alloactinosynnema sp. L-07]|uniref:hypothetical protein n=1 Tax=Alloactinosynnema sp. L-07 TaxID=1653480 RepID=UPI00065F089C|nr:hypothetical protein [Alloactinosynnema sp. L-07]CRK60911.1 hypothetical protein [Alloactinosynnema sp. L-07]